MQIFKYFMFFLDAWLWFSKKGKFIGMEIETKLLNNHNLNVGLSLAWCHGSKRQTTRFGWVWGVGTGTSQVFGLHPSSSSERMQSGNGGGLERMDRCVERLTRQNTLWRSGVDLPVIVPSVLVDKSCETSANGEVRKNLGVVSSWLGSRLVSVKRRRRDDFSAFVPVWPWLLFNRVFSKITQIRWNYPQIRSSISLFVKHKQRCFCFGVFFHRFVCVSYRCTSPHFHFPLWHRWSYRPSALHPALQFCFIVLFVGSEQLLTRGN